MAALLDARRGEVYAGVFPRPGEDLEPEGGDRVYTPEELAAVLPRPCTLLAGEGAGDAAAAVAEKLGPEVRVLPEARGRARAARIARIGARLLERRGGVPAERLAPRYVRRAEAEVRRLGSRFETP